MNKHKLMVTAMAIMTLLGGQALADDTGQSSTTMTTTYVPTCTLQPMTLEDGEYATLVGVPTASAATVNLTGMMNAADATLIPGAGFTLKFAGMCNYGARVSMKTTRGSFKPQTAPTIASGSAPFTTSLNYSANTAWGARNANLTTNGTAGLGITSNSATAGPNSSIGTIAVTMGVTTNGPLVAGIWSDTLTLQIGAAL